jgi:hypothetical protein
MNDNPRVPLGVKPARALTAGPAEAAVEGEVVEVIYPPDGWTDLDATLMTNDDYSYNQIVEAVLVDPGAIGRCWATHASRNFNGKVWRRDGRWYEQVWVRHRPVASYSAPTLKELMVLVNSKHGWE